jgi:DNA modification methylase
LPADSVHCVVTSPPYWGLRDYGIPPTVWGGDPTCNHVRGSETAVISSQAQRDSPGGFHNSTSRGKQPNTAGKAFSASQGTFCRRCNAWHGAGTTGLVANQNMRNAILIELNPEYVELARKRIQPYPWEVND